MITAASKFNFNFKDEYDKLVYSLNSNKLFTAIGLELSATNTYFHDNNDFDLKGITFGYFDHRSKELHINTQDDFFAKESSACMIRAKLLFILLHEIHHKVLLHFTRKNDRDATLWNVAADYEIHNLLYSYAETACDLSTDLENIKKLLLSWVPSNQRQDDEQFAGCFDTKYLEMTAEEIYDALLKEGKKTSSKSFNLAQGNGQGQGQNDSQENGDGKGQETVTVTEVKDENGKTIGKSVNTSNPQEEGSEEYQEESKLDNQVAKKELAEAFGNNEGKGNGSNGSFAKLLKKLFKLKIDWEKILKSSIQTEMSPCDYTSWTKQNVVAWCIGTQLPGREEDYSKYGTLIVALDESGSMSDDDVIKAFMVIKEAKEYYKQIILLEHDTEIVKETTLEELDEERFNELLSRHACGGTSHKCIFDYIKQYNEEHISDQSQMISCAICITDLESDIEEYQDIVPASVPMIYLANVDEDAVPSGIKGKVINMK